MDPQLPDKEKNLLRDIRKKYPAHFQPLNVGPYDMKLLQVSDIEPLLGGKDPFKDFSIFPFWAKFWEAEMILAHFLARQQPPSHGSKLLEIGAGVCVPGMVAAKLGYELTAVDQSDLALKIIQINFAANNILGGKLKRIDLQHPIDVGKFDTIIGAEILFREDLFDPLLETLRNSLFPTGVIYLAHDSRRKSLHPFLKKAEEEYEISVIPQKLKSDDEEFTIILSRLKPRNHSLS